MRKVLPVWLTSFDPGRIPTDSTSSRPTVSFLPTASFAVGAGGTRVLADGKQPGRARLSRGSP